MSKKTEAQKMSEMAAQEPQPQQGPDLPETVITPFAVQVNKITTQTGDDLVLTNIMTPGHVYTIKLTDDQAHDLATAYNGGVETARPNEISKILTG